MEASGRKLPASARSVGISLSAVSHAMALEYMLDRSVMPQEDLKKILARYFDSLTGASAPDARGDKGGKTRP
jgi:hypothetical protein